MVHDSTQFSHFCYTKTYKWPKLCQDSFTLFTAIGHIFVCRPPILLKHNSSSRISGLRVTEHVFVKNMGLWVTATLKKGGLKYMSPPNLEWLPPPIYIRVDHKPHSKIRAQNLTSSCGVGDLDITISLSDQKTC